MLESLYAELAAFFGLLFFVDRDEKRKAKKAQQDR